MDSLTVALTGATGYIASHTAVALVQAGHRVVGIDNFVNSSPVVLDRFEAITGQKMAFAELDARDTDGLAALLSEHDVDAVIHLAGLKAVGESVAEPVRYYNNNLGATVHLLAAMDRASVDGLVFSSSATVYSPAADSPLGETAPLGPINPYGQTKLMSEQIIADATAAADSDLAAINLRYFNPVGAHPSGLIGEDPVGVPNNLMPFVMQVAVGRRDELSIFGNDYPTPDGTCIRDYIHVCDLADGHVAAVEALNQTDGAVAINLGTGVGSSVLEVVAAAEQAIGREIPKRIVERRPGDGAMSFANPSRAKELLGWQAELSIADACVDHWRWQHDNPNGFRDAS